MKVWNRKTKLSGVSFFFVLGIVFLIFRPGFHADAKVSPEDKSAGTAGDAEEGTRVDKYDTMWKTSLVYDNMVEEIGFDVLGGAYYDRDGKLHILYVKTEDMGIQDDIADTFHRIVDMIEESMPDLESRLETSILLDTCKYTYNELREYAEMVRPYFSNRGIVASGIDDSLNKINVYIIEGADLSVLDGHIPADAMNVVVMGTAGAEARIEDL